jgi:hypothetical protein
MGAFMSDEYATSVRPNRWLMLAVSVWGGYVAIGTYRHAQTSSDSLRKRAVVIRGTVALLGPWALVPWLRRAPAARPSSSFTAWEA